MIRSIRSLAPALTVVVLLGVLATQQEEAQSSFVLLGTSWPTGQSSWRDNPSFPASAGSVAAQTTALRAGADNWQNQSCANWQFNYLGTTPIATVANDGVNAVFYTAMNSGDAALATTFISSLGPNITRFDMAFWGANSGGPISWSVTGGTAGNFDIEGIATHEFGHALGLDHETCDSAATMWPTVSVGSSDDLSSLRPDDIAGIVAIYGQGACSTSPTPDPMSFATLPFLLPTDPTRIAMVATLAQVTSGGVQYEFELVNTMGSGGDTSAWQTGVTYIDNGVAPNGFYVYRVRARNATTLQTTAPSTSTLVFTDPVTPGLVAVNNVTNQAFSIAGIAANTNPIYTEYAIQVGSLFVNATGGLQATETWRTAANWTGIAVSGLSHNQSYVVRCKARRIFSTTVQTAFGPPTNVMTNILGPAAAGTVSDGMGGVVNVLLVNGSAGDAQRRVTIPLSTPYTFEVAQPPLNVQPANYILWANIGIPFPGFTTNLGFGIGSTVFIPCDISPGFPGAVTVSSTYGQIICPLLSPGMAPATPVVQLSPGLPFPLVNLVIQGIIEQSPGTLRTTNALIFSIQ